VVKGESQFQHNVQAFPHEQAQFGAKLLRLNKEKLGWFRLHYTLHLQRKNNNEKICDLINTVNPWQLICQGFSGDYLKIVYLHI
jgi:hypothetical protein